jgi:hypothetical protein
MLDEIVVNQFVKGVVGIKKIVLKHGPVVGKPGDPPVPGATRGSLVALSGCVLSGISEVGEGSRVPTVRSKGMDRQSSIVARH